MSREITRNKCVHTYSCDMAQIRYEAQRCRCRMLKKLVSNTILHDTLENYMMQYQPLEHVINGLKLDVFVPTDNPFAFGLKI